MLSVTNNTIMLNVVILSVVVESGPRFAAFVLVTGRRSLCVNLWRAGRGTSTS